MFARAHLCALLLCAALPAAAEELKLDDLVSEALLHNPEILAAQKKLEASRQRPSQASALPDPVFSPGWNSTGNPLPGAGLGSSVTSNIGLMVTQEFPYPGKQRLRGNIARKEAEAQFEEFQLTQLAVASKVKQAFFRLQHAYAARDVLSRNGELLRKLLSLTEIAYSARKAMQQDVFKAQVQISLLETKILQLDRERRLRQAELNSLLDRPSQAPLATPGEPHLAPLSKSLAEIQSAARDNAPQRVRDQKMTERAELAVNLARKDFYPDYSLTGGYFFMGTMSPMYMVRADIKVPLYFRTRQRAALTEQSQLVSQARQSYHATAQSLDFRIAEDYSMAETSLKLVDLYTKTIVPQARLAVDSAMASYESGTLDFIAVLNNYTAALDYEMNYHDEMLNYHLALSRLEETTGLRLLEDHQ